MSANNLDKNCCHNAASANLPVRKFDLIPCGVLTNETGVVNELLTTLRKIDKLRKPKLKILLQKKIKENFVILWYKN